MAHPLVVNLLIKKFLIKMMSKRFVYCPKIRAKSVTLHHVLSHFTLNLQNNLKRMACMVEIIILKVFLSYL